MQQVVIVEHYTRRKVVLVKSHAIKKLSSVGHPMIRMLGGSPLKSWRAASIESPLFPLDSSASATFDLLLNCPDP